MAKRNATIFLQNSVPKREASAESEPLPVVQVSPPEQTSLPELVSQSQDVIYTVHTVFPFILFTDKVVIRLNHVDVIRGIFFGSASTTRVEIADIRQVTVSYNPIFATLEIIPQGPLEQVFRMSFLWLGEAMRARRIIAGLMESHLKKVDFSQYSTRDLARSMEQIGKTRE